MTGPTVAMIQARMSSSRLPGKVLKTIAGLPAIVFMVERLRAARLLDRIVVVTSTEASDDPLAGVLQQRGIDHVRGPLANVLSRYDMAARMSGAGKVVRLTADCPLIDPGLVDRVVAALDSDHDYASNIEPPTYPDGLDAEIFTRDALSRAVAHASATADLEHVTTWMRRDENRLRRASVCCPYDVSKLRWTVDFPADLMHVRQLVALVGSEFAITADRFDFLRAEDILNTRLGYDQ